MENDPLIILSSVLFVNNLKNFNEQWVLRDEIVQVV